MSQHTNIRNYWTGLSLTLLLALNTFFPVLSYAQVTPSPSNDQSNQQVAANSDISSQSNPDQPLDTLTSLASETLSSLSDSAEAAYLQNDSDGFYYVDFIGNDAGVVPNGGFGGISSNYLSNNIAGTVSIDPAGGNTATVSTIEVKPNSLDGWDKVELEATYSNTNAVKINLLTCENHPSPNTPISGFQNLTLSGGVANISSLNHIPPTGYDCIRVQVVMDNLAGSIPSPVVSKIKVSWVPLPVLLIDHLTPAQVEVGQTIVNTVRLSVSYAEACDVVAYAPLPETGVTNPDNYIDNYTPSYGQNPNPSFIEASDDGVYTASQITIGNTTIPANSVYWDLGCLKAGYTGKLTYKLKTTNGWENGILYHTQAYAGAESPVTPVTSDSDKNTSGAQKNLTELISTPKPVIDKTVSGTIRQDNQNHVYSAPPEYTNTVKYHIKISGGNIGGTGQETIFNPYVTDDLSDIYSKLSTVCGVASPSTRISAISTGGVLNNGAQTIIWSGLSNIGPLEGDQYFSFSVDYTGCPSDTEINNVSHLDSDNTTRVTDNVKVIMDISLTPNGSFAKGDRVDGQDCIGAGIDDNMPGRCMSSGSSKYLQPYGDNFEYLLYTTNTSTVTLGDIVMIDKIPRIDATNSQPHNINFLGASLPNDVSGSIWYRTDLINQDDAVAPAFDPNNPTAGGWINYITNPPATPSNVSWSSLPG